MAGLHTIHRHQHHFGWDNQIEAIARVEPGQTLRFEVTDAAGGQFRQTSTAADVGKLDFARVNPVCGPIYVEGAEPGDALEIEVVDIASSGWGWTAIIPGFGLLANDFDQPFLHVSEFDGQRVAFTPEIQLPTRPFTGTIGLAPAEPGQHSVVPPRRVGGNMDLRDVARGARLLLPVEVAGALFSVGDTHAAQGDGEVCGTAVETSLDVTLTFGLKKAANIAFPRLELPPALTDEPMGGAVVTTGIGPDLAAAAGDAIKGMIDVLGADYGLAPELAYCLCSVAVGLRISEIVDQPNMLVSAYLPKNIFV